MRALSTRCIEQPGCEPIDPIHAQQVEKSTLGSKGVGCQRSGRHKGCYGTKPYIVASGRGRDGWQGNADEISELMVITEEIVCKDNSRGFDGDSGTDHMQLVVFVDVLGAPSPLRFSSTSERVPINADFLPHSLSFPSSSITPRSQSLPKLPSHF
jgi:hypothetical protein